MPRDVHHLVMAVAWGYGPEVYEVFLSSLRHTGYNGDVKILSPAGRTTAQALEVCRHWRSEVVTLFNMTLNHKGLPTRMSGERFNMYATLCASYRLCLAADFRDVFFQSNPFDAALRAPFVRGVELLLPLENRVIGTCVHNSYFVRKCFGRDAIRKIGNQTVVCSGVILGTPSAFGVLRVIATTVRRCPRDKMSDQASLNFALYMPGQPLLRHADGRQLVVSTQRRGTGFTNTVGIFKGAQAGLFARDHMRDGVVLNTDGRISPIVHQFDRLFMRPSGGDASSVATPSLRLRAVDQAIGVRPDVSWLPNGA